MEKSIKSVATAYGTYLAILLVILTVLAYAFDLSLFSTWWFGIALLVIIIILGIISVFKAKKASTQLFTFKSAFSAYFLTVFIGTFISVLFSILLFNVIDTEASQVILENTMESTRGMLERFGTPQTEIDKALTEMQNQDNYGPVQQLKGYAFQLVFFAVIGLFIALIFREKDPNKI
ncbi:DUF4199 domain-containing protein [Salegentibacter sp. HM20]